MCHEGAHKMYDKFKRCLFFTPLTIHMLVFIHHRSLKVTKYNYRAGDMPKNNVSFSACLTPAHRVPVLFIDAFSLVLTWKCFFLPSISPVCTTRVKYFASALLSACAYVLSVCLCVCVLGECGFSHYIAQLVRAFSALTVCEFEE